MGFVFEELDEQTRAFMLREFEVEAAGNPYQGKHLSESGRPAFATLMRAAIKEGTEEDLVRALQQSEPVRFYRRLVGLSPAVVAGLV